MINEKLSLNFDLYTWEKVKNIFFEKKFENVILFSQARSGSTFVSNLLAQEFNFYDNFYPEEFFLNQHFVYLKRFIEKHDKFFLNTNEYWFRRTELQKNNTMYLYLYRNSRDILNSYKKAKKNNYYLGWEELINNYRIFFPKIKDLMPAPLFGHKVWEQQIGKFSNVFTLSYDSFKSHDFFVSSEIRDSKMINVKDVEVVENTNIRKKITKAMKGKVPSREKKKINFNSMENFYFFIRRKLESKKKSRKNY